MKLISHNLSDELDRHAHGGSKIYRVTIQYSSNGVAKDLAAIIKLLPENECVQKVMLESTNIFNVESNFYTNILPKCQGLLDSIKYDTPLSPRLLCSDMVNHKVLVFEDISKRGFIPLFDRLPTYNESRLMLTKLAQLHASSYKLFQDGETHLSSYRNGMFNLPFVPHTPVFLTGIVHFTELVGTIPGYEDYYKRLQKITPEELLRRCVQSYNTLGSYNVLNHGDFHFKNMMFRYDDQSKPTDVMFIDYQLTTWGSPAIDVLYHCTDIDELESSDDPVAFYFDVFLDVLKKLGYSGEVPKFSQLQEELVKHSHIEIFMFVTFGTFLALANGESNYDMDTVMSSEDARKTLYKSKYYLERAKKMLPILLRKGYLDRFD